METPQKNEHQEHVALVKSRQIQFGALAVQITWWEFDNRYCDLIKLLSYAMINPFQLTKLSNMHNLLWQILATYLNIRPG